METDAATMSSARPVPASSGDRAGSLALATLGQLVGQLAHDFNNLLATAVVGVELAAEDAEGRNQALLSGTIGVLARQRELTEAMSRAARACVDSRCIDLHALLHDCRDVLEAASAPLRLEYRLAASGAVVRCDATLLRRALLHLAMNARAAGSEGGTLRVETSSEGRTAAAIAGPPRLVLEVSDDGAGMPEEVREHAFDLFFTTRGAAGLGLPQVRDTMRRCGGRVALESAAGQGTRVRLTFPLVDTPS